LRLLQAVPNSEVLQELARADVVVDQLHFPSYGQLSVEAMASGCALATCSRPDYEPFPPNRPIWHVDVSCVYEQLRKLLTSPALRVRLARDARRYVERYHDNRSAAAEVLQWLRRPAAVEYEHYPAFYLRDYRPARAAEIPNRIRRLTAQIIRRWGLPADVDLRDAAGRGLVRQADLPLLARAPRWRDIGRHTGRETCVRPQRINGRTWAGPVEQVLS
jgi:hypothetical protein